jgi:putative glutamine amidotransferase
MAPARGRAKENAEIHQTQVVHNMNKRTTSILLILLLAALTLMSAGPSFGQDRFFDTAPAVHTGIWLAVFHPTVARIKDLQALRKEKMLDLDDLTVIGVYHRREIVDFAASRAYVRDERLDWVKFHEVEALAGPDELFRKNALTPEFERIARLADGIMFVGGPDLPPALYGSKTSLLTVIEDPYRHDFELSALFQLLGGSQDPGFKPLLDARPALPVLAICLGAQSLNVATGGTLVQDIGSEVYGKKFVEDILALGADNWHTNPSVKLRPDLKLTGDNLHPIAIAKKGALAAELKIGGDYRPYVLSSHHQAIAKLGRGLRVEATSLDGRVIEAVSHVRFPNVLGVQFHPENISLWDSALPYRLRPDEPQPPTWKGFLAAHPPSLDFHKRLWAWFGGCLKKAASTAKIGY